MAEKIEEYFIKIAPQVDAAIDALKKVKRETDTTKKSIDKLGKDTKSSTESLGNSFTSLKGKLVALLALGGLTAFIKKLAESNLHIKQMADRLNMSAKAVKGLQTAFRSAGYDEALANSAMEDYNKSYAVAKYKGSLSGILAIGAKLGVSANDEAGRQKAIEDFHAEIGRNAVSRLGGRENAIQYLQAEGMSGDLAALITQENYRELVKQKKEEAVVSDKAAESAKKLKEAYTKLSNKFDALTLDIGEQIGLWEGLENGIDATSHAATALIDTVKQLADVLSRAGEICSAIIGGLTSLLDKIDYKKVADFFGYDSDSAQLHQNAAAEGFSPNWAEARQRIVAPANTVYTPNNAGTLYQKNNPGNVKDKNGIRRFASIRDGLNAMTEQVARYRNSGYTLREMLYKYAPFGDKNNPFEYADQVSKWTGVSADVPMNRLTIEQMVRIASGMIKKEHGGQAVDPRLLSESWQRYATWGGRTQHRLSGQEKQVINLYVTNPEQASRMAKQVAKNAHLSRGYAR